MSDRRETISTPWGVSQGSDELAVGMVVHHTASHGGIKLDGALNQKVPAYMRRVGGWYEEDCEWAIVALVFPCAFSEKDREQADHTMRNWLPDEYRAFTGKEVKTEDSLVLRERAFAEAHVNDLVVRSAWGSWHAAVPEGMVGVCASIGADRRADRLGREFYFLVPADEYMRRGLTGGNFVVDPLRHETCEKLEWR